MRYLGDFAEDAAVRIYFSTNDGSGGAVAPSTAFEAADVAIYKDNSATQKATTNGITMTSPFDSIVGLHLLEIDTSNDTGDAGFWATGSDYSVVLNPDETVDSQTVVAALAQFSIENRNDSAAATRTILALPAAAPDGAGGLPISDAGGLDLDAKLANTNEVTVARMGALTDWIDGGRLDLLLDAIKAVTDLLPDAGALSSLATAAAVATVDSNVDAILLDTAEIGAAGAGLTAVPWNSSWDAEVESEVNDALVALGLDHLVGAAVIGTDVVDNSIVAKLVSKSATADWDDFVNTTDSLQAQRDNTDTLVGSPVADLATDIAGIQTDTTLIVADTNELQTDWADGGRLDVIQDAIKAITDQFVFTTANQVDCNALAINSTATSAARLALSADVIIPGTVDTVTNTHTPTTTEFQADDITEATADHFNGRIVVFTSGALDGQATDITDYQAVGGIAQFTVTALTEAPANNDTFIIV